MVPSKGLGSLPRVLGPVLPCGGLSSCRKVRGPALPQRAGGVRSFPGPGVRKAWRDHQGSGLVLSCSRSGLSPGSGDGVSVVSGVCGVSVGTGVHGEGCSVGRKAVGGCGHTGPWGEASPHSGRAAQHGPGDGCGKYWGPSELSGGPSRGALRGQGRLWHRPGRWDRTGRWHLRCHLPAAGASSGHPNSGHAGGAAAPQWHFRCPTPAPDPLRPTPAPWRPHGGGGCSRSPAGDGGAGRGGPGVPAVPAAGGL